ncbi:hypothetical protein J2751_002870 [Halorubrum alkaliphilum]|uniref:Agl cluster protein AglQ n=1 Tax=Halorubrum alkaliphilum TaxID=261290 RepID=A0A8T4GLH2_9EURY|nr:hypothetical protein [Halorubrum alkaliphilum]MBP1923825.1 hypothetical protein [Halorubrum alkaliphilum]
MPDSAPDPEAETITIHELLIRGVEAGIDLQCDNGSFPQRETSYYDDPQLPVRTTSQWLRMLIEAYKITERKKYLKAAEGAASYLISDVVRPHGYTFHCRNSSNKDKCNGVYGQAMPIWALTTAAEYLGRSQLHDIAADVAVSHPYDNYLSLWHRVEITGEVLTIDRTLNHQLAFAGAVSTVGTAQCQDQVQDFLDSLENQLGSRSDGVIRHFVRTPLIHRGSTTNRNMLTTLRNRVLYEAYRYAPSVRNKEVSYQATNLFWLSYLKKQYPNHGLWDTELVSRIVEVVQSEHFAREVKQTDMAFTASPTGFYIGAALDMFDEEHSIVTKWISEQVNRTFELTSESLVVDAPDDIKMASNICYLTEFSDLDVEIEIKR